MIASIIPGRLRLRSEDFKDPQMSLEHIKSCPGITSVTHNPRTGSLLIFFDVDNLDPVETLNLLGKLDPAALETYLQSKNELEESLKNQGNPSSKHLENKIDLTEIISLSCALLTLIISGFSGSKKYHIFVGMFFVELIAKHIYKYRKKLKHVLFQKK
ncbi:MAG: hypothetical protein LBF22_01660 [Deltaproteobacteria bacterium]|jgi:hypothetical protein|nr:hypothetical protein [Deltaproteobacteria bacterium]